MVLQQFFDDNTSRDFLIALAVGAGTYLGLAAARGLAVARLGTIAARTDTDIDDALVDLVRRTRWFFFAALAVLAAGARLIIPDALRQHAGRAVAVVVLLQVGLWIAGLIRFLTDRALKRRRDADDRVGVAAIRALGVAARVVTWAMLAVFALKWAFDLDITLLVTSLGVGGIAIALAVQTVLGDILAAISIVFDQPFDLGDDIAVDGVSGTVEKVGLKTTRIRSIGGEQIIFSNANLLKSRIHNLTRMTERRIAPVLEVNAATAPDTAATIPRMIEEIVRAQPRTRFVRAHLTQVTETGLRFEYVYFVLDKEFTVASDVQQTIQLEILRQFAARGILLPAMATAVVRR